MSKLFHTHTHTRSHSHDPADAVDSALESSAAGVRAVKIGLVGLGVTAVIQAVIVALSGSVALLADTIHNFSDAFTAIPLWIASWRAGVRRAEATPMGTAVPRISPASSSW